MELFSKLLTCKITALLNWINSCQELTNWKPRSQLLGKQIEQIRITKGSSMDSCQESPAHQRNQYSSYLRTIAHRWFLMKHIFSFFHFASFSLFALAPRNTYQIIVCHSPRLILWNLFLDLTLLDLKWQENKERMILSHTKRVT